MEEPGNDKALAERLESLPCTLCTSASGESYMVGLRYVPLYVWCVCICVSVYNTQLTACLCVYVCQDMRVCTLIWTCLYAHTRARTTTHTHTHTHTRMHAHIKHKPKKLMPALLTCVFVLLRQNMFAQTLTLWQNNLHTPRKETERSNALCTNTQYIERMLLLY